MRATVRLRRSIAEVSIEAAVAGQIENEAVMYDGRGPCGSCATVAIGH